MEQGGKEVGTGREGGGNSEGRWWEQGGKEMGTGREGGRNRKRRRL